LFQLPVVLYPLEKKMKKQENKRSLTKRKQAYSRTLNLSSKHHNKKLIAKSPEKKQETGQWFSTPNAGLSSNTWGAHQTNINLFM
jgi:hypothetical protein